MDREQLSSLIPAPPGWQVLIFDWQGKKETPDVTLCPVVGFALLDFTCDDKEDPTQAVAIFLHEGKLANFNNGEAPYNEQLLAPGQDVDKAVAFAAAERYRYLAKRNQQLSVRATFKILLGEGKTIEECLAACPANHNGKPLTKERVQRWIDKGMPL